MCEIHQQLYVFRSSHAFLIGRIGAKLLPVLVLRAGKATAVLLNAAVGRLLLGWEKGESRILDMVGSGTGRVYWQREHPMNAVFPYEELVVHSHEHVSYKGCHVFLVQPTTFFSSSQFMAKNCVERSPWHFWRGDCISVCSRAHQPLSRSFCR